MLFCGGARREGCNFREGEWSLLAVLVKHEGEWDQLAFRVVSV